MPWHTAVRIYSMLEKNPGEGKPTEGGGKVGVFYFIHFTVLKDVGDTMNLSALPSSGIKHVYCTCGTFIYFFCLTCLLCDELARGLFYSWSDRSVQRNKRFDPLFYLPLSYIIIVLCIKGKVWWDSPFLLSSTNPTKRSLTLKWIYLQVL